MLPSLLRIVALLTIFALVFQKTVAQQQQNTYRENEPAWLPLRFDFSLKRSSMKVFGHSSFSMFASPQLSSDNTTVIYDVFATFADGMAIYNYTFANGAAFISSVSADNKSVTNSVTCLDSESGNLPPINSIIAAINSAASLVEEDSRNPRCSSSASISINGIEFTLCAGLSGFTMTGSDINIGVQYMTSSKPELQQIDNDTSQRCNTFVEPTVVSPLGKSILTSKSASTSRKLKAEFDFTFWLDNSEENADTSPGDSSRESEHHGCSCKSTPRPCLFIHGMGIDKEEPTNVDSFSYYWGNLTDHAPCCSTMKFTVLDTVNNSWTNDTQQQKVCDRALDVSETSMNSTIKDTILVTHSMGNLMLAGAIASGKCSLDSTSTWVGLAGPMKGSMGSDFVQASCAGETNNLLEEVADITGKCPPTNALISLAYQGERFSSTEHDAAYTAAQKAYAANVYALMCSEGYSGLVSKYQAEFWVLGATVPHKSGDNDGMVEFQSCAAGISASKFGDTWRSRFYRTKLNHYDSEFLYGDGLLSEAKMPVK
ncbi:unnamed protein product [Phytophthora lilii]|uniref:Unnamed protein product n=1 Tax=Phytophthora lilii TaxID=2077276 RepID=A0A9W6TX51_9STRA|nr:unnamed protein product [Phytophthora lilii]